MQLGQQAYLLCFAPISASIGWQLLVGLRVQWTMCSITWIITWDQYTTGLLVHMSLSGFMHIFHSLMLGQSLNTSSAIRTTSSFLLSLLLTSFVAAPVSPYVGHIEGLFHDKQFPPRRCTSFLYVARRQHAVLYCSSIKLQADQLPEFCCKKKTSWIWTVVSHSRSAISEMMTFWNTSLVSETRLYPSASHPITV